jgi:hypothetical protein
MGLFDSFTYIRVVYSGYPGVVHFDLEFIETIQREMKMIAALERWRGTTKKLLVQEIHAVMS